MGRRFAGLGLVLVCLASPRVAHAGEGAGSAYLAGAFNDFAMAVIPGPPGLYLRYDIFANRASAGVRPLGGSVAAELDQTVFGSLTKMAYVFRPTVLAGKLYSAFTLPIIFRARGQAAVSGPMVDEFRTRSLGGQGDLTLIPAGLMWTRGDHSAKLSVAVNVPIGRYSVDRAVNLGRNYWAFDTLLAYTYLNRWGLDISVTGGVQANVENPDTDYRTGTELHFDWMVGWHPSPHFGFGATGYWFEQVTDDEGNIPAFLDPGFRGRGIGVGAVAYVGGRVGSRGVAFIAKWLHDVHVRNRFEGDLVFLSVAVDLFGQFVPPRDREAPQEGDREESDSEEPEDGERRSER